MHIAYLCGVSRIYVFMSKFLFKYLIKVIFESEVFLGVHFSPGFPSFCLSLIFIIYP